MIDVSIVLLNWNSNPVVLDAAASALAQISVTTEVIVVDNGSKDGSLEELKRHFPKCRFIEMGFNSGFTGGMNAGTDAARGEFVLWQNADLVLGSDYCARAIGAMRSDPGLGATGGLVRRLVDGRRTEEFDACGYTLTLLHRVSLLRNRRTAQDVLGVSGSCPIFRRSALETLRATVGYVLDPWYFTYGEDIDVMLRLNLAGWRVRYVPELEAWHVRSGSTVPTSGFLEKPDVTQVRHFKNRLATIIKDYPAALLLWRLTPLVLAELLLPGYLALRGYPRSAHNWLQAWREVFRERRRLLQDRRRIQRATTITWMARLRSLLHAQSSRTG